MQSVVLTGPKDLYNVTCQMIVIKQENVQVRHTNRPVCALLQKSELNSSL